MWAVWSKKTPSRNYAVQHIKNALSLIDNYQINDQQLTLLMLFNGYSVFLRPPDLLAKEIFNYTGYMHDEKIDEILGIVRCARCGQRLEGDIECPFCSLFPEHAKKRNFKWVYFTACFLTSPLSIYFIFTNDRLRPFEKVLALSGCLFWFAFYFLL